MLKTTIAIIAIAAAAPAYASDFSFDFKRHELETVGGAEAMFNRLEARVESYCTASGRRSLSQRVVENECIDDVLNEAVEQINDPRLNRIFARKSGSTDYAGSASDS